MTVDPLWAVLGFATLWAATVLLMIWQQHRFIMLMDRDLSEVEADVRELRCQASRAPTTSFPAVAKQPDVPTTTGRHARLG